jgi:hypothetical protein
MLAVKLIDHRVYVYHQDQTDFDHLARKDQAKESLEHLVLVMKMNWAKLQNLTNQASVQLLETMKFAFYSLNTLMALKVKYE